MIKIGQIVVEVEYSATPVEKISQITPELEFQNSPLVKISQVNPEMEFQNTPLHKVSQITLEMEFAVESFIRVSQVTLQLEFVDVTSVPKTVEHFNLGKFYGLPEEPPLEWNWVSIVDEGYWYEWLGSPEYDEWIGFYWLDSSGTIQLRQPELYWQDYIYFTKIRIQYDCVDLLNVTVIDMNDITVNTTSNYVNMNEITIDWSGSTGKVKTLLFTSSSTFKIFNIEVWTSWVRPPM